MAANKRTIVLTVEPKGIFTEGTADAQTYPGQCVAVKAATEPVGGRYTYVQSVVAMAIVREDMLLGRTTLTATASGERLFLYTPNPGDEINVRVKAAETAWAIGDEVGPDASGDFAAAGTGYICMETVAAPAGKLVHVQKR